MYAEVGRCGILCSFLPGCGLIQCCQYTHVLWPIVRHMLHVLGRPTQTSQSIDTINVHRTTPTYALATTPSKSQCWVHLILDPNERIQHHWAGLVQVEGVALHLGLRCRLVWVPSVDLECFDLGLLAWVRLLGGAGLRCRLWGAGCGGQFAHGGQRLALGVLDGRRHTAAECERRKAPCC